MSSEKQRGHGRCCGGYFRVVVVTNVEVSWCVLVVVVVVMVVVMMAVFSDICGDCIFCVIVFLHRWLCFLTLVVGCKGVYGGRGLILLCKFSH